MATVVGTIVIVFFVIIGGLMYVSTKYVQEKLDNAPSGCRYLGSARDLHQVEFYSCGPEKEIFVVAHGNTPNYKGNK